MTYLSRLKNWADNTQLWGTIVLVAIIGGALISEARETEAYVDIATKVLRGERVKTTEALRLRSLSKIIEPELREAGISEADIHRLQGDELLYTQLSPSKR